MRLTIYGKSAHGSTPELGINAGLELIALLGEYYDLAALKIWHHFMRILLEKR